MILSLIVDVFAAENPPEQVSVRDWIKHNSRDNDTMTGIPCPVVSDSLSYPVPSSRTPSSLDSKGTTVTAQARTENLHEGILNLSLSSPVPSLYICMFLPCTCRAVNPRSAWILLSLYFRSLTPDLISVPHSLPQLNLPEALYPMLLSITQVIFNVKMESRQV